MPKVIQPQAPISGENNSEKEMENEIDNEDIAEPTSMPMPFYRDLPELTIRVSDLPELGGWEVHSQHYIVLRVNVVGKNAMPIDSQVQGQSKMTGNLKILSMKALGTKPVSAKELDRQEWGRVKGELLSGRAEKA